MRAIVTGQVGMDKKPYLERVVRFAGDQGENVHLYNLGDIMYDEAPDVKPGTILNLPLSRLNSLRRAAFKDVLAAARDHDGPHDHVLVNTHATFRWRHGLFAAFDFDQIALLKPDLLVCLVDNIELVHHRLHRDHVSDATLKDCMVWREEEILATELLAQAIPGSRFAIVARGRHADTRAAMFRLVLRPAMRRVYPSFPMSHVADMPEVLAEIDAFRAELAKHFIAFDPGDVDEKLLLERAIAATRDGRDWVEADPHPLAGSRQTPEPIRVRAREVLDIAGDIDGQIYMRDFKLIDQSDMIVSLIPELPGGIPGLSSGVERELQHAFEHAKEVYVVWKPKKPPSPFITETATAVFPTVERALAHFESRGYFGERNLFGH